MKRNLKRVSSVVAETPLGGEVNYEDSILSI